MHVYRRGVVCGILLSSIIIFSFTAAPAQTQAPATPPPPAPQASAPTAAESSAPLPQGQPVITPTQASSTAPETQSLHIQVGRSVLISTQAKLRRILVSNPNVLETVTVSPLQVAVSAKAPGSSNLMLWDETGHTRILDVYADVDVAGLREALNQAFPGVPIQSEGEQGRVILSGTVNNKAIADEAIKIAGAYSKDVVNSVILGPEPHSKQLMLKVRFAEVNRTKLASFGVNILSTGAANTPGTISTQQFGSPSLGQQGQGTLTNVIPGHLQGFTTSLSISDLLNIFVYRPDLDLGATIRALQQKNVLEILAEPNLMARSGEPAKFLAGGEFPFPVLQGGVGVNTITIQFRPFGVRLEFTGTIGPDNVIRLKVSPEVSALDFSNAVSIAGFTIPAISTRRAETEIELRDGQSFGIAGLLDQRTTAQLSKIPGIGDIPVLGNLFKSRSVSRANTELMVLVTPVIVDPLNEVLPSAVEPAMPIPQMELKQFDRDLPKGSAPPASEKRGTK